MWTTYLLKLLFLLTEKPQQGNDKPNVNFYIHLLNQSLGVPTKTKHLLFAREKSMGLCPMVNELDYARLHRVPTRLARS